MASGLLLHNPTSEFNEKEKETFLMLSRKYQRKPNAIRPKKTPGKEEELNEVQKRKLKEMEEKAKKKAESKNTVVNLNVDDFADDVKNLQIIRPNMEKLDKKEVERMRRIAKEFEDKYNFEMMQGLDQPGNRLKIEQYEALKNRDCSARIYRNAKQRLAM